MSIEKKDDSDNKEKQEFVNSVDNVNFEVLRSLAFVKYMYSQGTQYYSKRPGKLLLLYFLG
ncbi:hypothetical protein BH23THE1_BH23THE1_08740 [soil metagenome]